MAFHCSGSGPVFSLSLLCFQLAACKSVVLLKRSVLYSLVPKLGKASVTEFRELFVLKFVAYICIASPVSCLKSD